MDEAPEISVPQPPAKRVFPPWSVGRIVGWIVVGAVVSVVMGVLIGLSVATVSIYLTGSIDLDLGQLASSIAAFLQGPVVFGLIWFLLRRKGYCLADVWGSSPFEWRQLGLVSLAAVAFMSSSDLLIRVFHLGFPPMPPAPWDWRLMLVSEIILAALIPSFMEELLFRGLLYRAFRLRFSAFDAALFSSLVFALTHTPYLLYPFFLASVFLTGLICAFLLERTRSLNASIAFHFAANTTTIVTSYFATYSS